LELFPEFTLTSMTLALEEVVKHLNGQEKFFQAVELFYQRLQLQLMPVIDQLLMQFLTIDGMFNSILRLMLLLLHDQMLESKSQNNLELVLKMMNLNLLIFS
jgi:hypothetical protein